MTRRLAASRLPPADVRLSSRASTGGSSPTFFGSHSNASSRPSAVQDRPRESATPDLKMPVADQTRVDPVLSVTTSRSVRAGPFLGRDGEREPLAVRRERERIERLRGRHRDPQPAAAS